MTLEIVTPDVHHPPRAVSGVNVPTPSGRRAVLPRHEKFLCEIIQGEMAVTPPAGGEERWRVGAGSMEVTADGVMLVLRSASRDS